MVALFAVCAFIAAGLEAARAFGSAKTGSVIVHLLFALGRPGRRGWSRWPGRAMRR